MHHWLWKRFVAPQANPVRSPRHAAQCRPPKTRLVLEELESRLVPSADTLTVTINAGGTYVANQPVEVVVQAFDASGNADSNFSDNITLSLFANSRNATLGGQLSMTASQGKADFVDVTLSNAGNGYTVEATDTDNANVKPVTSGPFNVLSDFSPATLPNGQIGASYSQMLTANYTSGPYSNYTVTIGTLPADLTLDANSGTISGTPTANGVSTFTIQADNSQVDPQNVTTLTQQFTLIVGSTAFNYNANTETLVITLPAAQPNFTYTEAATVNGGTTTMAYTFTLSGSGSPVSETFTDAQLTTAPAGAGASVTVIGQGLAGTAILITNVYQNNQTDTTPARISLGSLIDAGVGTMEKFIGNNTANPEYGFLSLQDFPVSYAYAGRNDGTIQLYGTQLTGKVGFVTAGYYSYIAAAVTGAYAHFGEGTPEVVGTGTGTGTGNGNTSDFAYHYTSSLPSTASSITSVFTVGGNGFSSMSGSQTNPEDGGAIDTFDNEANGFVLNTAVAYTGNSIALINDSRMSDTYVGEATDPLGLESLGGIAGYSYMFVGAYPNFNEFDVGYGFGTYYATSTLGGHDIAYPGAPANNVFSGNWIRAFS